MEQPRRGHRPESPTPAPPRILAQHRDLRELLARIRALADGLLAGDRGLRLGDEAAYYADPDGSVIVVAGARQSGWIL